MNTFGGDEVGAVVLDLGTHTMKAGFAGEENPKAIIPSVIGTLFYADDNSKTPSYYIGNKEISFPRPGMEIQNIFNLETGEIQNIDYFERALNYIYDERLGVKLNEHPLLMSEDPLYSPSGREKLTSLIFEKCNVPSFFLSKQPVLSCFANGKYTALVVDSGHNSTTITPVHDGFALRGGTIKSTKVCGKVLDEDLRILVKNKRGGKDILAPHQFTKQRSSQQPSSKSTKILEHHIEGLTQSFNDYSINRIVGDMKINLLRVSEEGAIQTGNTPLVSYELNDGNDIEIGLERFTICERLFDTEHGLAKMTYDSINRCEVDLRKELYSNILLVGGNTLIPGAPIRYDHELTKMAPNNVKVKHPLNTKQSANIHTLSSSMGNSSTQSMMQTAVAQLQERKYASFIGGSILASLGTFQSMWISKSEFDEMGAAQCLRKCP